MCRWVKTNHRAVHYAQRQQTLDSESERSCSHECSGEQAGETSVRHAGGTSGRTSDGPYRTKRLLTEHGPCVGAHRPLAGDAHGGHCHLDRGGGTWRTLPHLAATHIRQLVRRRALSGGGAQPSGQLVPAASQNDQAPPRYRAYLFGAVGGIAPDSGDLLARDSRPDQQPDQVHRRRSKRPRGPQEYIKGLFQQNGLGSLYQKVSGQLGNIQSQVQDLAKSVLSSTPEVISGIGGYVAALATVLTLTFFLILGSERYLNAGVGLFAETYRPLVRRLLTQSAGAVTGYVTGNLAISSICGVSTFIVLLVLGMPYAAALALLVAVLDLVPLVGATLGGALLVIVGLFVAPWKAVVLLIFIVVYQQVEGSVLQPMVY